MKTMTLLEMTRTVIRRGPPFGLGSATTIFPPQRPHYPKLGIVAVPTNNHLSRAGESASGRV